MIDTVVLMINSPDFELLMPEKFEPHASIVLSYKGRHLKAVYDQSYLESFEYLPRVSLVKRLVEGGWLTFLYIEFSAPTILFGNNFFEVRDDDFPELVSALKRKLFSMGVVVDENKLADAPVSKIHFGKNFVFTDHSTPFSFIEEIRQANISKRLDANQADYRNEGHSFKIQNNTMAVIFYDKMKDLQKARRSLSKSVEDNPIPHGSLQGLLTKRSGRSPLEVLRMEVQLNKRIRIKSELKRLKVKKEPVFSQLFSHELARSVCLSYLEDIRSDLIFSKSFITDSQVKQFMSLKRANPDHRAQVILEYLGFMSLVEETDLRTARKIVAGDDAAKWRSLQTKFGSLIPARSELGINKLIRIVREFKSIRALDFQHIC